MVRSEVAISWLLDLRFWVFFPLGTTINLSGLFGDVWHQIGGTW